MRVVFIFFRLYYVSLDATELSYLVPVLSLHQQELSPPSAGIMRGYHSASDSIVISDGYYIFATVYYHIIHKSPGCFSNALLSDVITVS